MKICLLGEIHGMLDEGARNITTYLTDNLSKHHQVLSLDLRSIFSRAFWRKIKDFKPDIIHYVHGGSINSFILTKVLSHYCSNARSVLSVMNLSLSPLSKKIVFLSKPDVVLVQSHQTENTLKTLGCRTEFLPNGVDVKKFRPASKESKEILRQKYKIAENKFVLLHVGSVKKRRNVLLLESLQGEDNQVLIIGSTSTGSEKKVYERLVKKGCIVWLRYFENIEEIYALSDCYIFPTIQKYGVMGRPIVGSIEMPLSVLEAMSCNLPVITTRFGALPGVFEEGDGIIFAEREEEFINAVEKIKNTDINVKTREKVLPFAWENVVRRLEEIYEELLERT